MLRIFIMFCLMSTSAFATEDIILSVDNYPAYIDARKNISQGHSFSFMWYKDSVKLQEWVFLMLSPL